MGSPEPTEVYLGSHAGGTTWVAGNGTMTEGPRITFDDLNSIARRAVVEYHAEAFRTDMGHEVFRVPNNAIGRLVRWLLSRYLNHKAYKLTARGRVVKRGHKRASKYDVGLKNAKELAIYISVKRGHE